MLRRIAPAALAALALGGCSVGGDETDPGPQQVESRTTKVEVVKGLGAERQLRPPGDLRPPLAGRGHHHLDLRRGRWPP